MRNIKKIESFLPESQFFARDISELVPEATSINEALRDGDELDGKILSDVKVSEWLWDFSVERKSFPSGSSFDQILNPDEDLSIFSAQMVNTFAVQAWKAIRTKKLINAAISDSDRAKIISSMRGIWSGKKRLDSYMQEKNDLIRFIHEFESFLMEGKLGESIQIASGSIVLSKVADPQAGPIKKIVTTLKSFFEKSKWQRAIAWLINNLANNEQHVKWLDTTVYEPNMLSSGISPDVNHAISSFVVEAGLNAEMPSMETAMPSINKVAKLAVEKSKQLPQQGADTWMGCLYNTYLFGLYQKMLIIGCCAWTYDLIGETDIMTSKEIVRTPSAPSDSTAAPSISPELETGEHNGIKVYRISYMSPEFKDILDALLGAGQIGAGKYNEYINRIDSRKDSRSIIRSVRIDVLGWGNTHGFRRTDRPDVKGLYTDGSTRLIIPIEMYNSLVK